MCSYYSSVIKDIYSFLASKKGPLVPFVFVNEQNVLYALDLACLHAFCADIDLFDVTIDICRHFLNVWAKRAISDAVRVAHIATCARRLIAYDTYLRHFYTLLMVNGLSQKIVTHLTSQIKTCFINARKVFS